MMSKALTWSQTGKNIYLQGSQPRQGSGSQIFCMYMVLLASLFKLSRTCSADPILPHSYLTHLVHCHLLFPYFSILTHTYPLHPTFHLHIFLPHISSPLSSPTSLLLSPHLTPPPLHPTFHLHIFLPHNPTLSSLELLPPPHVIYTIIQPSPPLLSITSTYSYLIALNFSSLAFSTSPHPLIPTHSHLF